MGITYKIEDVGKVATPNGLVELTNEEKQAIVDKWNAHQSKSAERKLKRIKRMRNQKLSETDWKVTSAKEQGTNLSTSFKNYRQGLRDIPSTYTTESEYDELLATDDNGNLTHSVWSE